MTEQSPDDNVVYIDEFNRERWLLKLRVARETGRVAVFNQHRSQDAQIIPFRRPDNDPDGAA